MSERDNEINFYEKNIFQLELIYAAWRLGRVILSFEVELRTLHIMFTKQKTEYVPTVPAMVYDWKTTKKNFCENKSLIKIKIMYLY